MPGLAELAGWLLGSALLFGIVLWLVAALKWLSGGDPRPALLWGTVFIIVGAGGYGVITWFLPGPPGGGPGGAVRFAIVPADYYASTGRAFEAARYFPVEVTVVPIFYTPGFCGFRATVNWGTGRRLWRRCPRGGPCRSATPTSAVTTTARPSTPLRWRLSPGSWRGARA